MIIDDVTKFNLNQEEIKYYLNKIKNNESIVVITGEFSSGKTCFLNTFLGKEKFLPHTNGECTPVLIDIMDSTENYIAIKYKDGREEEEEASEENIKKYTKYTEKYDTNILSVSIPVKSEYLIKNTHIIDSPGTNTIIKEHEEITNYILKKADIVIYAVNKVISDSDVKYIKEICKYTEDIIFIVTHIDEVDEEQRRNGIIYKSQEQIKRFVNTIKKELEDKLGLEDVEVLPIGSKVAFKDYKYIEPIRECINSYIELNSIEMIKKRVKKQLKVLFENKLKSIEKENKFFTANMNIDKDDLQSRINSLNNNISKMEEKNKYRVENIDLTVKGESNLLKSEIKALFEREQEKLLDRLLKNKDITSEIIENEFNNTRMIIGQNIKEKIKNKIENLLKNVYSNMNSEIKRLMDSVDIKLEANIRKPIIEELDDSDYKKDVQDIIKMKENSIQNLRQIENEIACTETEKEEITESIKQINDTIEAYRKEMNELGMYIPEYEEVVTQGGGESGAKIGRVFGEVADLCLLVTPVGAPTAAVKGSKALTMMDKVKDTIKSFSYIEKVTRIPGRKPVKTASKIKRELEKVKKATEAAGQARNKVVQIGNEIAKSGGSLEQIGNALDVLSVGYWGEKIGKVIGETIKPTETILVENEQQKIEWNQQKYILEQEINNYRAKKLEIEEAYKNADTIKQKRKLKNELKSKNDYYNELLQEMEEKFKKRKEEDNSNKIENYYKQEIKKIFTNEMSTAQQTALLIFNSAKEKVKNKSEEDLKEKILEIEANIQKLVDEKDEIQKEIDKNKSTINELEEYDKWIEQWVNEYASI
ncbi:dynamin family protein [Clostridium aestuarii]|uniref:Dynamin family protein n=1 Tax=Clostridium aestuarii TaxID=338193 RepID=A0ABT4D5B0_9CLOT|nr:dynamin family protein [Clostridium aestuarii]MCY6485827.1 dynamin family protein [Clostridium aestuarii]